MMKTLRGERKQDARLNGGHRYCGVAAAMLGSAVIGGIAANSAGKKAAKAGEGASELASTQADISKDQWDTYKTIYQPLEKQYVQDAQDYDNPANREEAAGLSSATIATQFGKARERLGRTPGLDPSSAAYTSSLAGLDSTQAAADAVGQNAARQSVEDRGWARRTDALSLGKGLPAQASAGLGSAASLNAQLAGNAQAQANGIGAGIGNLAFKAFDAWNTKQNNGGLDYTPDASYAAGGGRANDFSENMQEYGI